MPTDLINLKPYVTATNSWQTLDIISVDTSHSVDQPVGTCRITAFKPLGYNIGINSTITVTAGYPDGGQGVIFKGRVASIDHDYDEQGNVAQLRCEGYMRQLRNPEEVEIPLNYLYPFKLSEVIRNFLYRRGVPTYQVDDMRYYDDDHPTLDYIYIAGNQYIGPESNKIPPRTSLLSWATQKVALYGYRLYDRPDGTVRLSRVSGLPTGTPVATFTEGENIFSVTRSEDTASINNYVIAEGAKFTDSNGIVVQIRNVPAFVPFNPDLNPPGYRVKVIRDAWIQNDDNAECVRAIEEIDNSTRRYAETWETWGSPNIQPGDRVRIISPSTNPNSATDNLRWVLSVDHTITDRGWFTTIQAWAGAGSALPEANDCATMTLGGGSTYHIGDQTRSNFQNPTPVGKEQVFPFTVANTYTSLSVHGLIHGSNHGSITSSTNTPRNLSRVETWQGGVRVSSVDLPTYFDSLSISYASPPTNWEPLHLPLPGSLAAGSAELRFIAGEGVDLQTGQEYDDYEVRGLTIRTCGIGSPVLPT